MGMYTDWNIQAKIKPEYVETIRHFIKNNEWPEPVPEFIIKWRKFLLKVGRSNVDEYGSDEEGTREIVYYYCPPVGGKGKWGFKNEMDSNNTLTLCGTLKNNDKEIEVFLTKVLVHLSSDITQCWTISDFARDNAPERHFDSDSDEEEHMILRYSDDILRKTNWRRLSI